MKKFRQWLLFKGVMRILKRNNRIPTIVIVRDFCVYPLVKRLKNNSFYCDVEDITETPIMKKVHIVSLLG